MYLPVLDQNPTNSAEYLADVHLNNSLLWCLGIVNTATHVLAMDRITEGKDMNGVPFYLLDECVLHEPYMPDEHSVKWIKWAKDEYQRGWWFAIYAWALNNERRHRFPGTEDHPAFLKIKNWRSKGIFRHFPKNNLGASDFPVVIPESLGKDFVRESTDPIELYRAHYRHLKAKGRARMRWTGRLMPDWMEFSSPNSIQRQLTFTDLKICTACQTAADPRTCDYSDCPNKKLYNL